MDAAIVKAPLRRLLRTVALRIAREYRVADLTHSAVVFSPHPDDETLGCGGTIIKKTAAGASVKIVCMTDGSRSHRRLILEDELRRIRMDEAHAAARTLGVAEHDVMLLGFEDGKLSDYRDEAVRRVSDILRRERPVEVFLPYRREMPPDHAVTYQVVMSALLAYGGRATIYEYPVWFWQHWPWTSAPTNGYSHRAAVLIDSLMSTLRLFSDFRCRVDIGDVLERKCAALEEHRSQMTRYRPGPRWPTLRDVSNGEFLECFLQNYELFHQSSSELLMKQFRLAENSPPTPLFVREGR